VNNTGTKKVALWNKRHFEEKNGECPARLRYSVLIIVEKMYIKRNIWRVAVRPSWFLKVKHLKSRLNFYKSLCTGNLWRIFIRNQTYCTYVMAKDIWTNYTNLQRIKKSWIFEHVLGVWNLFFHLKSKTLR
jgi:hypothetical protein